MFKRTFATTAAVLFALLTCMVLPAQSVEYQHSITADKMTFDWSVEGDQLAVKLSAPTKGWVAVGFNPSSKMKDANIIIGYVKDGKVKIEDDFGMAATQHKMDDKVGGKDNVTVVGGTEEGDTTTIEFSIPLNSGDEKDGVIDPAADTTVILGYGGDRDSFRMKHVFNATIVVNLSTGAQK
ncbi:DOMON domain-containing protein [Desulforhopalus sp. IMCC35007]|uniref:DOMON domain-containing protein n=1 Tax=Desulforhopalus sp. IMCC35007 TaxID=2569543 RepID=UPI0010AE6D5A|nr:DOMON domain-containing protein [Desulforhopalus sp. IMCC35007]TKB06469.1 DOMON domain-containing protein [Desulforhopalus sp. IMCC35007]